VLTAPNALGYISLGQALQVITKGARVRLLSVDRRSPSIANTRSGAYPFSKPLLMLVKGKANPAVRAFLDFLSGPEGQAIVEKLDFIPVNAEAVKPPSSARP
jgi:phosphate transport system substrate-binding protein